LQEVVKALDVLTDGEYSRTIYAQLKALPEEMRDEVMQQLTSEINVAMKEGFSKLKEVLNEVSNKDR
jgi:galactokinase/mevalonate kinase-like predicted kinase